MCGRSLKVPADLAGVTVVGLGVCGVLPELGDGVVERGEPGDLLLDVAQTRFEQVTNVFARRVAIVADM